MNLVTIALSFVPGGQLAMFVRGTVGIVGTKLVLLQEEYSATEFVKDVVGQAGGALRRAGGRRDAEPGVSPLSQAARPARPGVRLARRSAA